MSVVIRFSSPNLVAAGSVAASVEEKVYFQGTNGRAVLLVHGLTGSPYEMKYLAHFFHERGYTVSCPRLANHGQPLDVLKQTKWTEFYDSVRKAFFDLTSGHDKIFVAGLSMGALLSLALAEEYPDAVAGVSCLSPTLFYDGWNVPWSRIFLPLVCATPLKDFFYFKEEPPYGIKNEKIRQLIHRYYSRATLDNMKEVARHGYPYFPVVLLNQLKLLIGFLRKRFNKIITPVQIIQARYDDMTSPRNAQFIYDRVSSKKKEIVYLEDSYHVITADQEKDKVAYVMDEFFGHIRGASS